MCAKNTRTLEILDKLVAFPTVSRNSNLDLIDWFEAYLDDPSSVPDNWRMHFDSLSQVGGGGRDASHRRIQADFRKLASDAGSRASSSSALSAAAAERQAKVLRLINAYRVRGHQNADLDPLHLSPPEPLPELDVAMPTGTSTARSRAAATDRLRGLFGKNTKPQ